ncbi:unnamed protein product [Effrenium voratum]|nr:unnamed protein product [Effrenium voratum]
MPHAKRKKSNPATLWQSPKKRDRQLKRAAAHTGESRRERQRLSDGFIPRDENSIHLCPLPPSIKTKYEVKDALELVFGPVSHVHLDRTLKFGFARFAEEKSTAAALQLGSFEFLNETVEMKSACKGRKRTHDAAFLGEPSGLDLHGLEEDPGDIAMPSMDDMEPAEAFEAGLEPMEEGQPEGAENEADAAEEDARLSDRDFILQTLEAIRAAAIDVLRNNGSKMVLSELESLSNINSLKQELPGGSSLVQILRAVGSFRVKDRGDGVFEVAMVKIDGTLVTPRTVACC